MSKNQLIPDNPSYRQDVVFSIDKKQLVHFDLEEGTNNEMGEIMASMISATLRECCERFVFQLELTNETNLHFQCRVNLKTDHRWRPSTFSKWLMKETRFLDKNGDKYFYRIGTTPTSRNCTTFSYVTKPETRVQGPWSDRPVFLGKSIYRLDQLRPWQIKILDLLEYDQEKMGYDWRTIYHVLDEKGNSGKSSFCRYLMYHHPHDVGMVNAFGSPAQVNTSLVGMGSKKLYIVDLPRSYSYIKTIYSKSDPNLELRSYRCWHNNWPELANIIEHLKDGMLIDTMYGKHDVLLQDPPAVVIFSNWPLQSFIGDRFSSDRLKVIDLSINQDWLDNDNQVDSVHEVLVL